MKNISLTYKHFDAGAMEWNDLVYNSPQANLLQTWEYGEAKATSGSWQAERGVFSNGTEVVGAVQTMVRTTPFARIGLAWINRGPFFVMPDNENLDLFITTLRVLRDYLARDRGLYLRVAPMLTINEFCNIPITEMDLGITGMPGWASSVVDLTVSKEDLRKALNGKWRNALVRAERANLKVRSGTGLDIFNIFLDGHKRQININGTESGIKPHFLFNLNQILPERQKIRCLVAYKAKKFAGSIAIATYGRSGEYLAGNSSDIGRGNNVGQLLLWLAMLSLKDEGFEKFDLGGMDEESTPKGIYRFKNRVGGTPYRLANELEFGTKPVINKLIKWYINQSRKTRPQKAEKIL